MMNQQCAAATAAAAAVNTSTRAMQRRILYGGFIFFGCYFQIAINFYMFSMHKLDTGSRLWQMPSFLRGTSNKDATTTTETKRLYSIFEIEEMIASLKSRLSDVMHDENTKRMYQEDGIFLPFTIRDARRTVPVQIPYGFRVFDFINGILEYEGNEDDDDDALATAGNISSSINNNNNTQNNTWPQRTTVWSSNTTYLNNSGTDQNDPPKQEKQSSHPYIPATLFLDGYQLPAPYNTTWNVSHCVEYSTQCYRSHLLQVIKYLLNDPTFQQVQYFFYMESDNDLCTSLNEIRSLAYQYKRYFISTGIGTSGWITSRAFLKDFYDWYSNADDSKLDNRNLQFSNDELLSTLTEDQRLDPDTMASILLRKKQAWSVTRRYLTSHTILTSTDKGVVDMSLHKWMVYDTNSTSKTTPNLETIANNSSITGSVNGTADQSGTHSNNTKSSQNVAKTKQVKKKTVKTMPPLVPKRHLPRCLEPHRAIWSESSHHGDNSHDENNEMADGGADMFLWNYFDYHLCPDSQVFPCEDGQLDVKPLHNLLRGQHDAAEQ
jgi:hypothetical protein